MRPACVYDSNSQVLADAVRELGGLPRFWGIVGSSVLLLGMGLIVSVAGSMVIAEVLCNINPLQYAQTISRFVGPATLAGGLFRSLVYGTIVAAVSCHKGYTASGGARGVGRAVTQTAIFTNLYIVIANYVRQPHSIAAEQFRTAATKLVFFSSS